MKKNKKGVEFIQAILAQKNVRKNCLELGISRSQYYKLLKKPARAEPQAYVPSKMGMVTANRIVELALLYPFGCHRISDKLAQEEVSVSAVSVQKILNQKGLGTAKARFEALEQKIITSKFYNLNVEQEEFIKKHNSALLEISRMLKSPGELVSVFTYFLGQLPFLGKVYINFGLDAYSGYVHASVGFARDKYLCAELLQEVLFPFYAAKGFEIQAVETSNEPEFFSFGVHPFSTFLLSRPEVVHQRTVVGGAKTNGFCQYFCGYLLQYVLPVLKQKEVAYTELESLNADLNAHLVEYNQKLNPHAAGYYNRFPLLGKSPLAILQTSAL